MRPDLPHVPLEAGLGPDNPPCPACGEPLFPWLELPGGRGLAERCEECELGITGAIGTADDCLTEIERGTVEDGTFAWDNRASWQRSLTGGGWWALESSLDYRFTPEALDRLLTPRGRSPRSRRWLPGRSITGMWQSIINTFTFGHNVGLGVLGRAPSVEPPRLWMRMIDLFITVVLAIPAILIALVLEALAALIGKAGSYSVEIDRA